MKQISAVFALPHNPIKEYLFHGAKNGEQNKIGEKRGERKLYWFTHRFLQCVPTNSMSGRGYKKNHELDADWVPISRLRSVETIEKQAGDERGRVEKKERSLFLSRIPLVADPARRPPAFSGDRSHWHARALNRVSSPSSESNIVSLLNKRNENNSLRKNKLDVHF